MCERVGRIRRTVRDEGLDLDRDPDLPESDDEVDFTTVDSQILGFDLAPMPLEKFGSEAFTRPADSEPVTGRLTQS